MATIHTATLTPRTSWPIKAWRGEADLKTVFWGYGVFTSMLIIAAFVWALMRGDAGLQQMLLGVFAVYTTWVLVSVWRCAEKVAEPWSIIARSLTVAWVANAVLVAGFLQLRLIEGYLGF